jgi:hypothetical protein
LDVFVCCGSSGAQSWYSLPGQSVGRFLRPFAQTAKRAKRSQQS